MNTLWLLSLVITLTCALLATLLQQWARRYLKVNQSRYCPHKRARIRAFLSEGVEKLLLLWAVETLPTLLHISLFLFFAGLVVFLWNVNLTIFKVVLSWVGICTTLYGWITVMPIFRHDSPYLTPLSLPAWHIVTGIQFLTFRALQRLALLDCFSILTYRRFEGLAERYGQLLVQSMQKTVEETALNSPSEIDTRAFLWMFDSLDEDHELESFFSGLPGFRSSKVVKDPLPGLTEERKYELFTALLGLLDRTFSSELLPESVKNRRAIICAKAITLADFPEAYWRILWRIIHEDQHERLCTAEFARILSSWADGPGGNPDAAIVIQAALYGIVAKAQRRNSSWFILASSELGTSEAVLRDYAAHGDSLSLAILIHIVRQQFNHFWERSWPQNAVLEVLRAASKFNVRDTSSDLQYMFCALWNQVVREVQNGLRRQMAFQILGPIRNIYIALHQGTDSAPTQFSASTGNEDTILKQSSSYPVCNIPGHYPDWTPYTPHAQGLDVSPSTTIARVVVSDNAALIPTSLDSTPGVPSFSVPAPRHDENVVDVPLLEENTSVSAIFHLTHQTSMESVHRPDTSPDPVVASSTRNIDISPPPRTMHLLALGPSGSTPLPKSPSQASTSPPDVVAVEHTADSRTPSLNIASSPIPTRVLDDNNMLPTLPSDSPVTGTDHTSSPVSHSLMLAPGASGPARPWLSSTPDMGAAAQVEDSAKAASRKEMDALDPASGICEDGLATPVLPPQSPSPPPVIDETIASLSTGSL